MLLLISFNEMANNKFFVRNVTPSFPHEPFFKKEESAKCSNDDTQTKTQLH